MGYFYGETDGKEVWPALIDFQGSHLISPNFCAAQSGDLPDYQMSLRRLSGVFLVTSLLPENLSWVETQVNCEEQCPINYIEYFIHAFKLSIS